MNDFDQMDLSEKETEETEKAESAAETAETAEPQESGETKQEVGNASLPEDPSADLTANEEREESEEPEESEKPQEPEEQNEESGSAPLPEAEETGSDALPANDEQQENTNKKKAKKNKKGKGEEKNDPPYLFLLDLLQLVAASLATVMLILAFCVRQSPVLGSSMKPTILGRPDGEDVLLITKLFYTPEPGDIVVIQTPTLYLEDLSRTTPMSDAMDHSLVKRVIATGGDELTIDFAEWRITVNGEVFEEGFGKASYVNYPKNKQSMNMGGILSVKDLVECTVSREGSVVTLKIPEGKLFVMGDNRQASTDSRRIGLIDERWIAGKAILRIYPTDRIGSVE